MAPPPVEFPSNRSPLSGPTSPEAANRTLNQAQSTKPTTLLQRLDWLIVLFIGIIAVMFLFIFVLSPSNTPT
jgi:hypothetical protein